jgi:hypothetical protein
MKLKLLKIQEGFFRGNINYHSLIKKTAAEVKKT